MSLITTTQLADTFQVVGTLTCLVGAKTITEAGLFDTATLSPTTTVSASLTASATSITVGSAASFPAPSYYLQLENEIVLVTATSTNTLTVTRGSIGSTSAVHSSGVPITLGGDGNTHADGGATTGQTATVGAAQGGSIFAHADFAGIALSVNDSITFTWKAQLT